MFNLNFIWQTVYEYRFFSSRLDICNIKHMIMTYFCYSVVRVVDVDCYMI